MNKNFKCNLYFFSGYGSYLFVFMKLWLILLTIYQRL